MTTRQRRGAPPRRRGAVAVLVALLMVFIVAMVAFGVDIGYIVLVRSQLQNAADAGAMAGAAVLADQSTSPYDTANAIAAKQWAGGQYVSLDASDVEVGTWDSDSRTFTASADGKGNAVRVTARRTAVPLFFGAVLGKRDFDSAASAVAMANPRDICFVVDLSGSMNDDTECAWVTNHIDATYAAEYPSTGSTIMQAVYDDFAYGPYPGTLEFLGASVGVAANSSAYANLTRNSGPLTASTIPAAYRILSGDSESTRKRKAYSWLMDTRLTVLMPGVKPTINSATTASYNYWQRYIDYVIWQSSAGSRGTIPSLTSSTYRITGLNNPNNSSYPSIGSSVPSGMRNFFGYKTYVNFMMDLGRDVTAAGTYTPLSRASSDCPYHSETVGDRTFSFPPREQPTHAARRSIISAIQVVEEQNETISNLNARDWVSIVTFDHLSSGGPVVQQALTGEYEDAMEMCATFQAVCDDKSSTATETGLIKAQDHITANGRTGTSKVIVLLTDGVPNLYSSSNSTINSYISDNPSSDFYGSGYAKNAPLMQSMTIEGRGWYLYPIGLGLGTDYDFMDRMARMAETANDDGDAYRSSGNPVEYEQVLTEIFEEIINSPKTRLVQ